MTVYRMHRAVRLTADYTGAMLAGGRWNPIGTPVLYAAQHLSLACLEILVHLDKNQLPRDYVWSKAELPNQPDSLTVINLENILSCQLVGAAWLRSRDCLAVQVPSAVIPEEFNILLNPIHDSYQSLTWKKPERFEFDPRLFLTEPNAL